MNIFLNKMQENLDTLGSKIALVSSGDQSVMTYAQLNELSGRVYGYLKKKGIGKDNVVMVCLPRNLMMFPAMIGVWKAGAAYVLCEDSMAPERIKYTEKNSDAVLTITMDNWQEIMETEALPGREKVEPHDLAYLVYTSGTTGNPKGAAHEYGNLEQSIAAKNVDGERIYCSDEVLSLTSPFQVNANIEFPVQMWYVGGTLVLMDYAHTKNPAMLIEKYEEYGVTATFMTPSLYRSCSHMNSQMRSICLGGEPAVNLYSDTVQLYNAYNMSEAGRDILTFKIDKPYGVTPVGKNQGGDRIYLLKEDGSEAAVGEQGEICFKNDFVRGYMNLPEKTAQAWRDGLYHSNDIGELLEDGNIVLKGRNDDMIKINGNRIEPAEIEVVSKELLGLTKPCAKGFITEKQSFVVLYYTDNIEIDPNEARAKLETRLNYYMIPSYFIHVDEYPLLPSGKLDKKALKAPDISAYKKAYAAPETETEKKLCAIIEKVLEMDHIGINDDFYELGGDSLTSMEVVMRYDDPALDAAKMFQYRTIKKIAAKIEEASMDDEASLLERDAKARSQEQPVFPSQHMLIDTLFYIGQSTVNNMPELWKIKNTDIDADRLAAAVQTVLENHPVFKTRICYNEDVELVQRYDPSVEIKVEVEHVTEEEYAKIQPTLLEPVKKVLNSLLYKVRIYQTESNVYFFFDINHFISDGTSLEVIHKNISKAYYGEPLAHDYYYLLCSEYAKRVQSEDYQEAKNYFFNRYADPGWVHALSQDAYSDKEEPGFMTLAMPFAEDKMNEMAKKAGGSANVIAMAGVFAALRDMEHSNKVFIKWLYHARGSAISDASVGPIFKTLVTGVDFTNIHTAGELVHEINNQIALSIKYQDYPFSYYLDKTGNDEILLYGNEGTLMGSTFVDNIPAEQIMIGDRYAAAKTFVFLKSDPDGVTINFIYRKNQLTDSKVENFEKLYCKYCLKVLEGGEI